MEIEKIFKITTKYSTSIYDRNHIPDCLSLTNTDIGGLIKILNKVGAEINRNRSKKRLNDDNQEILADLDERDIPGLLKRLYLSGKLSVTIDNYNEQIPSTRMGGSVSHENGIRVFINYSTSDYKEGSELVEKVESAIKKFYNI